MRRHLKKMMHLLRRRIIGLTLIPASKNGLSHYRSILVVAPHPDDEIIGLGGYLVRQSTISERVTIVYLTDGEKSLEDLAPGIVASERLKLTRSVLSHLGIAESQARWLHLPDGAVPRMSGDSVQFTAATDRLASIISEVVPDAVFVTHPLETWPYDHIAAYELVTSALKRCALSCDLYGYWVWLWYSMPLRRIADISVSRLFRLDIAESINQKGVLMKEYLDRRAPDGRPWSGVLPAEMLKVFRRPFEVVEKLPVS